MNSNNIGKNIASIYEKLISLRSNEVKKLGIQPNDYNYFLTLLESPGCNQNYLAKRRRVDKSFVTRIVNKYEKMGLFIKKPSIENKSAYSIYLTNDGKKIAIKIDTIIRDINMSIKSHYTKTEYENLTQQLETLSKLLDGGNL